MKENRYLMKVEVDISMYLCSVHSTINISTWRKKTYLLKHIEKHFISNCASISWRARLGLIFESVHISKVSKWTFFCSFVIQISILSVARSVLMNTPSERWSPNPVLWLHLWLRKIESNQLVIQSSGRRHLRSPRRARGHNWQNRTNRISSWRL